MADDENDFGENKQPPEKVPEEKQAEKNPDVEDPRLYSPLIQSDNPALKERGAEESPQPEVTENTGDADETPEADRQPDEKTD